MLKINSYAVNEPILFVAIRTTFTLLCCIERSVNAADKRTTCVLRPHAIYSFTKQLPLMTAIVLIRKAIYRLSCCSIDVVKFHDTILNFQRNLALFD